MLQNLGNGTAEIIDFTIHRNRKQYEDTISNGYKSWFKNSSELIFENQLWYESLIQLVPGTLISNTERGDIKFIYTEGYKITPDKTKGDTKLVFTGTNDSKYIQDLIIEIKYKSISPFDSSTYYLTYRIFHSEQHEGEILDKKSIAYEEGY